jgi:hypothetical protein
MARRLAIDPREEPGLCGEELLVITLLKQVVLDLHSAHPGIRTQAVTFLHDSEMVEFWTSLVGIDRHVWLQHAQQALTRVGEA